MSEPRQNKGPWIHRFLIGLFSVIAGLLCFWLLGFVVDDIVSWPGPSYETLEKRSLDQKVAKQQVALGHQIADTQRKIANENKRQELLRDSTASSQTTMNQLLEFQKLSLQKDVKPSPEEQQALADSQQRFLANQKQYQVLNQEIVKFNQQLKDLSNQQREVNEKLQTQRKPIQAEFKVLQSKHKLMMAVVELSVLIPLLLIAVVLFLKFRGGTYAPLAYAFGVAVLIKVGMVMHEHFPSQYFKYLLILATLAIVIRILVHLLRMVAFPRKDWLLKRYLEAYEVFLCPICSYPIRRGPLRYAFWTRRTIKKMRPRSTGENDREEIYTCPTCSTQLYEKCSKCGEVRHSLLPSCHTCGDTKSVDLVSPP
jgi:hypothetical protein